MDDEPVEAIREGTVVSSLDDGRITFDTGERTKDAVQDPVCHTWLPNTSAPSSTYEGVTYYFCGEMCRREFDKDPARYVYKP